MAPSVKSEKKVRSIIEKLCEGTNRQVTNLLWFGSWFVVCSLVADRWYFFFPCGSSFWKNEDETGGGLAGLGGDTEAHPYVSFTVNLVWFLMISHPYFFFCFYLWKMPKPADSSTINTWVGRDRKNKSLLYLYIRVKGFIFFGCLFIITLEMMLLRCLLTALLLVAEYGEFVRIVEL